MLKNLVKASASVFEKIKSAYIDGGNMYLFMEDGNLAGVIQSVTQVTDIFVMGLILGVWYLYRIIYGCQFNVKRKGYETDLFKFTRRNKTNEHSI